VLDDTHGDECIELIAEFLAVQDKTKPSKAVVPCTNKIKKCLGVLF